MKHKCCRTTLPELDADAIRGGRWVRHLTDYLEAVKFDETTRLYLYPPWRTRVPTPPPLEEE